MLQRAAFVLLFTLLFGFLSSCKNGDSNRYGANHGTRNNSQNYRQAEPVRPNAYNPQQYQQQYYAPQPVQQQYYQYQNAPVAGSRYYSNPYDIPPYGNNYAPRYDTDQYYVPPTSYQNVEPQRSSGFVNRGNAPF